MKNLTAHSYTSILADIETFFTNGRKAVMEMYWKIGQRIVEAEQGGDSRAPYGAGLIEKLSKDLSAKHGEGFSKKNLERMRLFYNENPIAPPAAQLTWSKHAELLSIKDPRKRRLLEKKALRDDLSRREVRALVQKERISDRLSRHLSSDPEKDTPILQLKFSRGSLSTYSTVDTAKVICPKGMITLDLGFDLWRQIKKDEAAEITLTDKPQYTYSAFVEKVIDGDTLWAQIECGFGTVTRQKLRLRGIDCPEVDTPKGKDARNFTRRHLPAGSLIVIRTHKDDKYGRYLADVFFLKDASDPALVAQEGVFLNQQLLDEHLAVGMQGGSKK